MGDTTGDDAQHSEWVGQPHPGDEHETISAAEQHAAKMTSDRHPLGRPGRKFDRRSPFMIGLTGAAGVLVTVGAVQVVLAAHQALLLVVAALLLAIGMEPAVSWLARHGVRRGFAVTLVYVVVLAGLAAFLWAAIVPLIDQGQALVHHGPDTLRHLEDRYPLIKQAADRFHLEQKLQQATGADFGKLSQGLLGAGKVVFGAVTATVIVGVLTAYFSANFPALRTNLYRLFPHDRRPRAILIGDAIFAKVGGYVLGNLLISVITGVLTFVWLAAFGVPFPLVLAVLVAVLDLIPLIGSTLAGIAIALVALTVSLPVSLATVVFFVLLRWLEDYLLVPRVMGRTVQVPAVLTVVSVLIGGSILGVLGALLAIPIAAGVLLLIQELLFPRLDKPGTG
ncbi:AI-2E family transporter [Nocardia yunnanensis]|uniref:AI-2E family transporter n=1 Tax=Nocardia yunnanensis TaxID=2382165 RepID=A0A386ZGF2_9NOCA|nr:AI-2E family transporter [Nocardia yunnanensis]AYF76982.1 AI-2E family transporter [Nocardia yunnanensis]